MRRLGVDTLYVLAVVVQAQEQRQGVSGEDSLLARAKDIVLKGLDPVRVDKVVHVRQMAGDTFKLYTAVAPHPAMEVEKSQGVAPNKVEKRDLKKSRGANRGGENAATRAQKEEAHKYARMIMDSADKHSRNGRLSVNEMRTFLRGGPFEAFTAWLTGARGGDRGHFSRFDKDMDGSINTTELEAAVLGYLLDDQSHRFQIPEKKAGPSTTLKEGLPPRAEKRNASAPRQRPALPDPFAEEVVMPRQRKDMAEQPKAQSQKNRLAQSAGPVSHNRMENTSNQENRSKPTAASVGPRPTRAASTGKRRPTIPSRAEREKMALAKSQTIANDFGVEIFVAERPSEEDEKQVSSS